MPSLTQASTSPARWLTDHGDILWGFILARVKSPSVAEDLMQETLVAALGATRSFEGRSSERTWLLGIASHKVTDYFRARPRLESMPEEHASGPEHTKSGRWKPRPGAWDIGRASQDPELLDALGRCIESLPPGMSELVWLHEILQVPREEACKLLGLSPTNLWTRAHRARAALRRCIEGRMKATP